MNCFLGIDFGTSGARTAVLDETGKLILESRAPHTDPANPQHWREALFELIAALPKEIRTGLSALAIDGTSGTLLATDAAFEPVSPALLYNDGRAEDEARQISVLFPPCQRGWREAPGDFLHQANPPHPPFIKGGDLTSPLIKGVAQGAGEFRPVMNGAASLRAGESSPLDKGGGEHGEPGDFRSVHLYKQIPPAPLYQGGIELPPSSTLSSGKQNPYGPTSGLAKRLWLARHFPNAAYCFHQADWLAALLTGKPGITDYHNALKSGYDVENLMWPDWVAALPGGRWQQKVLPPGEVIGPVDSPMAKRFGLNPACKVRAGTTDSIAAFIAAGATRPGEAVTSLGTTLVLKLLSEQRVDDPATGVYSHRFGRLWLAGGASNAGGGVLKQFFSNEGLAALSARIDPGKLSGFDYYPLPGIGERFPINDPHLAPRLDPRPQDETDFLHGLLEGMARIEAMGYEKLHALGASPVQRVVTSGGGAQNETWRQIRQELLKVPVTVAQHTEAAFGAAQLGRLGKALLPG